MGGFVVFYIVFVVGLVMFFVGLMGFIVEFLWCYGVMMIFEYYEKCFGRGVCIFGGLFFVVLGIFNMGFFFKVGLIFFILVIGFDDLFVFKVMMMILFLLVFVYVMIGGMMVVVFIDYV